MALTIVILSRNQTTVRAERFSPGGLRQVVATAIDCAVRRVAFTDELPMRGAFVTHLRVDGFHRLEPFGASAGVDAVPARNNNP